jgi:hypothetical protein
MARPGKYLRLEPGPPFFPIFNGRPLCSTSPLAGHAPCMTGGGISEESRNATTQDGHKTKEGTKA